MLAIDRASQAANLRHHPFSSKRAPGLYGSSIAALFAVSALALGCAKDARVDLPVAKAEAPSFAFAAPTVPAAPVPVPLGVDVAGLVDQIKPAVVNILTTREVRAPALGSGRLPFFFGDPSGGSPDEEGGRTLRQQGAGSGFIIDPSGYVVTNEHVVDDANEVLVRLADDRELRADVVGRDPKLDLALLKLEGAKDLPIIKLGSSEALRVGEQVLAVGNPFGLGHTVTLGIVSAKARTIGAGPYDDFIQTDASINPGNSGGPLFNLRGEVIGINTAIRAGANGIGFAIPVDALKDVLPQLREAGHVQRGKLGLRFQEVTRDLAKALALDATKGALVAEIEPGSAAARAGLKEGDLILGVNGSPVVHAEELPRKVARNRPGTTISLSVLRGGQKRDVSVTLDAMKDDSPKPVQPVRSAEPSASDGKLGIRIANDAKGGVRVEGVMDEARAGELRPGDVITQVNDTPVQDIQGLRAALQKVKPGTTALVKVRRGDITRFAALPMPAK